MKTKAFTLVELMIAVAIIGILAAIAYPGLGGMRTRARLKEVPNTVQVIAAAERVVRFKTGDWYYFDVAAAGLGNGSSWGNRANYAQARTALRITLPNPNSVDTMCIYSTPVVVGVGEVIQFNVNNAGVPGIEEGRFELGAQIYDIRGAGTWNVHLMYLDDDGIPY